LSPTEASYWDQFFSNLPKLATLVLHGIKGSERRWSLARALLRPTIRCPLLRTLRISFATYPITQHTKDAIIHPEIFSLKWLSSLATARSSDGGINALTNVVLDFTSNSGGSRSCCGFDFTGRDSGVLEMEIRTLRGVVADVVAICVGKENRGCGWEALKPK